MKLINVNFHGFRGMVDGLFKHKDQLGDWCSCRELSAVNLNESFIVGGESHKIVNGNELYRLMFDSAKEGKLTPAEAEDIAQFLERVSYRFSSPRTVYHMELRIKDEGDSSINEVPVVEKLSEEVLTEDVKADSITPADVAPVEVATKRGRKSGK